MRSLSLRTIFGSEETGLEASEAGVARARSEAALGAEKERTRGQNRHEERRRTEQRYIAADLGRQQSINEEHGTIQK
jgi:hypothetical protein